MTRQQILEALIMWVSNTESLLNEARLIKAASIQYPEGPNENYHEVNRWKYQCRRMLLKARVQLSQTLDLEDFIDPADLPSASNFLKSIPDAEP
jgi:hypothetical protein